MRSFHRPFEWLRDAPLATGERQILTLSVIYVILYSVFWIMPAAYGAGEVHLLSFAVAFAFTVPALIKRPNAFPLSFPILALLVLQLWSFFCSIYVNQNLGRPIRLGRVDFYLLYAYVPAFVVWRATLSFPPFRLFVVRSLIVTFAASAAVAWGQFLRISPAMRLSEIYTYKPIDNWDGHPGIRAVGLTAQPNHLAYQAVVGLALVCAPVLVRPLTRTEYVLAGLFSSAAVFTQSRAGILPLAFIALAIVYFIVRRSPKQGAKVVAGMFVAGILVMIIGAKRFDYMMMTTSGNDYSAQAREDVAWSQVHEINERFPLTGVGPSSGLLLGGGAEDKWVPVGRPVESGYLVARAMYGIPGLLILIIGLAGSTVAAVLAMLRTPDETQKQLLAVGFCCALCLAINAYFFNTLDSYIHLPLGMMIAGLAASCVGRGVSGQWRQPFRLSWRRASL